jgi:hypothetical protein
VLLKALQQTIATISRWADWAGWGLHVPAFAAN